MNPLEKHRKKIDKIDNQILKRLSERLKVVKDIKKYKRQHKLPITDKAREKIIFQDLNKKAKKYKLNNKQVKDIYKVIIKNSKKVQKS